MSAGSAGVRIHRVNLSESPVIDVRFTVADGSGAYVQGLGPGDLRVLVDSAEAAYGPNLVLSSRFVDGDFLTLVFAVDVSGSMREAMPEVKAAIAEFVARLGEKDEVALLTFNESTNVPIPPTGDPAALMTFLDSLEMRGNTALYDAVAGGLDILEASPNTRRALIAVSDGSDNRSTRTMEEVRDRAVRGGIAIYGLALGEKADTAVLSALATATGGRVIAAVDPAGIRSVYSEVAGLLINEYRLVLTLPPEGRERWHTIRIDLAAAVPGLGPETSHAERPFLATRNPGASQAVLIGGRAAAARASLVRVWALAFFAAFVPISLLAALVARRRGMPFDWRLWILTVLLAGVASGVLALLYTYY